MAIRVTHSKVSGKPQGSDPARVYGNHWDEDHIIEGLTPGVDVQPHDATLDAISGKSLLGTGDIVLSSTLSGYQPIDSDLTAIAALSTTAYGRSLLTLANATALAAEVDSFFLTPAEGNAAYQPLDTDLTAIAALTTTSYGRAFLALADAAAARTAIGVVIGTDVQAYDADLAALATNSTNGLWARTGAGTGAARTITAPAAGITVTNGDGVSGNPTLALANDLAALEGLASTGLAARTATDTWAQRTITAPAAGITVTNGNGVSGNPTLALANDLAALEGLSSNGMIARTATDTAAVRTITAGATGAIVVTNGDGVSGNPTIEVDNTAWTSYTPTITPSSGSITTSSATGFYKKIGKTVFFRATLSITNNGTGSGFITSTLPLPSAAITNFVGREILVTGSMVTGTVPSAGSSNIQLVTYNNGYPAATGAAVIVSGCYETT